MAAVTQWERSIQTVPMMRDMMPIKIATKNTFIHFGQGMDDEDAPDAVPVRRCQTGGPYRSEPDERTQSGCSTPVCKGVPNITFPLGENTSVCGLGSLDGLTAPEYISGSSAWPWANMYFNGASTGTATADESIVGFGLRTPSSHSGSAEHTLGAMPNQGGPPVKNTFVHFDDDEPPPEHIDPKRSVTAPAHLAQSPMTPMNLWMSTYLGSSRPTAPALGEGSDLPSSNTSGLASDAPTLNGILAQKEQTISPVGGSGTASDVLNSDSVSSVDALGLPSDGPLSEGVPSVIAPNSAEPLSCDPASLTLVSDGLFAPPPATAWPWGMVGAPWNSQMMMPPPPFWCGPGGLMPYDPMYQMPGTESKASQSSLADFSLGSNNYATTSRWGLFQQKTSAFPPQAIQKESTAEGGTLIRWNIQGNKLKTGDQKAVSPPFEMLLGNGATHKFKLMLFPKTSFDGKGGRSFRKSKGKGYLQLKCEADTVPAGSVITFRFFSAKADGQQNPFDWVKDHDFSRHAVCPMAKDDMVTWHTIDTNGHLEVGIEVGPR